jgi:pimeloyl-ACP methyl ester carboxylesterase
VELATWEDLGHRVPVGGHGIFVVDLTPPDGAGGVPPVLLVHGYPTASVDWGPVAVELARDRRVVALDLLGFGLSDKPDQPYSLFDQADVVEGVCRELGLDRVVLVTHDMGDSVGGELLARSLDGDLGFEVERRVVTNGSIYLGLAHLTPGQLAMLEMPDELFPAEVAPTVEGLVATLTVLMGEDHRDAAQDDLRASVDAIMRNDGNRLLVRINRYLNERKEHEGRWTGAIERHPAPLGIVWGEADPIAVTEMATRLHGANPSSRLEVLDGVGHFPMIEVPERFLVALRQALV